MYKNKYIIFLLFLVICFISYLFINYYYKKRLTEQIINEWINITHGGYIKFDDSGNFKGDCYLSFNNYNKLSSHIHLIQNCREYDFCYIIKKNNIHSQIYKIDESKNVSEIVQNMIQNYNSFKG